MEHFIHALHIWTPCMPFRGEWRKCCQHPCPQPTRLPGNLQHWTHWEGSGELHNHLSSSYSVFSKLADEAFRYIQNEMWYQVTLLEGLPLLEELPRGDFLCDALEWLEETDPERCSRFFHDFRIHLFSPSSWRLRLGICEFWASEDYFFHHSEQLQLVSTVCPNIRKMLFMFRWVVSCWLIQETFTSFNSNTEAAFRDLLAFGCLQVSIETCLWMRIKNLLLGEFSLVCRSSTCGVETSMQTDSSQSSPRWDPSSPSSIW